MKSRFLFHVLFSVGLLAGSARGWAIDTDGDGLDDAFDPRPLLAGDQYLDSGFNATGILTTADNENAVAEQSGKLIVVGGSASDSFRIKRYNTDGSLDVGFGTAGIITDNNPPGSYLQKQTVMIQSDSKIVVTNDYWDADFPVTHHAVKRHLPDGGMDPAFSSTITYFGEAGTVYRVIQQADGKLVVTGYSAPSPITPGVVKMVLARHNTNGTLDSGFNGTGIVTIQIGNDAGGHAVLQQPDGKLVVGGSGGDNHDFALLRYNSNGLPDSGFGTGGIVTTSVSSGADSVYSLIHQSDGKLVVAGSADQSFAISRYHSDGVLDTEFGSAGKTLLKPIGSQCSANTIFQQADGKFIVAGYCINGSEKYTAIVRLNDDGSVDVSFGVSGVYLFRSGNNYYYRDMIRQADGKLVLVGNNYVVRLSVDLDGDSIQDVMDNCGDASNVDQLNTDGDSQGDACDADDDNDVVLDINDAFPLDAYESVDTDGDGTGNNADTDDDNDGVLDAADKFPLNASISKFIRHDTEADGDSDLLTRSASLGTWTRHMVNNAAIIVSNSMNAYTSSSMQYQAQLDANGDGDADILTRNTSTGAWYLHQVQDGEVTGTTPIYLYANLDQQFVGAGDFNNDGTDDVMLRSASGGYYTVFLLANHAVNSTVFYNAWASSQSVPQGIGDFDGDGADDLLVRRTSDNLYFIFKTTAGATNSYACACNVWRNPDWTFQFAGDTNKDGTDDIVIRATGASGDGLWWNFRMSNFSSTQTTNLNTFKDKALVSYAASGDYNADGYTDMLIRVNNGPVYVARIVNGLVSGSTTLLSNLPSDQMVLK